MIVIDYIAKFFLERERFEVFPSVILRFEEVDSVLEFVYLLRLPWNKFFIFLQHAAQNHDVLRVEAESEVISDFLWHFNV